MGIVNAPGAVTRASMVNIAPNAVMVEAREGTIKVFFIQLLV